VERERTGCEPATVAPSKQPHDQVDVLEVGEDVLVESADALEGLAVERGRAGAGADGVSHAVVEHRALLAVEVVEGEQRRIELDARRVDDARIVGLQEHSGGHRDAAAGVEGVAEALQELRLALDVVVQQDERVSLRLHHATVDRSAEADVRVQANEADARRCADDLGRSVGRAVVDHDDLVRDGLPLERPEQRGDEVGAVERRDDDGDAGRAA